MEVLSSLHDQVSALSPRERELIYTIFLEELSLADVALKEEDHCRLNSILSMLSELPPLEGISWVIEQLRVTSEDGSQWNKSQYTSSFDDEAI